MELVSGGELFDYIVKNGKVTLFRYVLREIQSGEFDDIMKHMYLNIWKTPDNFSVNTLKFELRNDPKFWTDRSGQTVQTQIRLLLEEQSSLIRVSTVCYSSCIFFTKYSKVWHLFLNFSRLQQSYLTSENLGTLR